MQKLPTDDVVAPGDPEADATPLDTTPARRRFLFAGAGVAATLLGARSAGAQQAAPPKPSGLGGMVRRLLNQPPPRGFDPFKKNSKGITQRGWESTLTRLVRRSTYGVTPEELARARQLGFYGYLNQQLNPTNIDDRAAETFVALNYPDLSKDGQQLYSQDQGVLQRQLSEATLMRAAFSRRQLYERMVEFWSDHFNITYREVLYLKLLDDRDVIRKHALGKFPDLLRASAHSPAMLEYLDNTRNRGNNPNQNYAREVMELHTLDVDGGYTQQDVAELSRCLTGWTIAGRGNFFFDVTGHDYGEKTVLGVRIPAQPRSAGAAGKADGDTMLTFLVNHPNTARYISKKMLRYLLQYEPTDAQITSVAREYTRTGGDIKAMIRAVLTPENLMAASPKLKRPYHYVVSALRATRPTVATVNTVTNRWLSTVGQPLFAWDAPDGYPDRADYWAGGVLQRWNFATYLTTTTAEVPIDINSFTGANTPESVADSIGGNLFGGEMPDRLRNQLLTYLRAGTVNTNRVRETVALALGSSQFQWY
jgi:uncharacterized protein (DUF1800 family)